ncbi:hypothetical protein [Streptomyces goshikiensis]|uniref:hypothetical protein n=1 Tax=Streptomyces goshikiensis TaxID=1942 RepID=UPI00368BC821
MSLYPVLWAIDHAPVNDAEERAILVALVVKGDFDGMNCFRSYPTLAAAARVDPKTAGRRCRAMESRGILRRQTKHQSRTWVSIPKEQRPVIWEVMIPAEWWSAAQLESINEQRAGLGRAALTPDNRPALAAAPPKRTRSDKGVKRSGTTSSALTPGTDSPRGKGDIPTGGVGTASPHPPDLQSRPRGLQVPQPSESPSESPSEKSPLGSALGHSAGGFARAGAREGAGEESQAGPGGSAANQEDVGKGKQWRRRQAAQPVSELVPVAGEEEVYRLLDSLRILDDPASRIKILRRAVRAYLGHNPDTRTTAFDMYPRTPAHAATRINWKWHITNGPDRAHPEYDGPDRILRPAGYLATLLIEQECELPQCEMGVHLDSGEECRLCRYREVERIGLAASKRLAAEHRARLQQQRDGAPVHHQSAIDALYDEAVAANAAYDRIRAARVAAAAETDETARLREQLAQAHPELAAARSAQIPRPREGEAGYASAGRRGRQALEEETARAALVREGLRGTALDDAVRSHMAAWRARRRQGAPAADLAACAVPVGAWPTGGRQQPEESTFRPLDGP